MRLVGPGSGSHRGPGRWPFRITPGGTFNSRRQVPSFEFLRRPGGAVIEARRRRLAFPYGGEGPGPTGVRVLPGRSRVLVRGRRRRRGDLTAARGAFGRGPAQEKSLLLHALGLPFPRPGPGRDRGSDVLPGRARGVRPAPGPRALSTRLARRDLVRGAVRGYVSLSLRRGSAGKRRQLFRRPPRRRRNCRS